MCINITTLYYIHTTTCTSYRHVHSYRIKEGEGLCSIQRGYENITYNHGHAFLINHENTIALSHILKGGRYLI